MKICLFCNEPLLSKWQKKFCNVSCQNKYMNPLRTLKNIEIESICEKCETSFKQIIKENSKSKKSKKRFCSRKCANSHIISDEMKFKLSKQLKFRVKIKKPQHKKICEFCKNEYLTYNIKRKFCSKSCSTKNFISFSRKGGLKSSQNKVKRSKNEIYFSELCKKEFSNTLCNAQIFNGWDADIILPDLKIAILWNGKWHYEKITKQHSVSQVENRDKIKINEIIKFGYSPYIIKDMGKYNKTFVEKEFEKFKNSGLMAVAAHLSHKQGVP